MRALFSEAAGIVFIPGDDGGRLVKFDASAADPHLVPLIDDWQEIEGDTLEAIQSDVASLHWCHWSVLLIEEALRGLSGDLLEETLDYLESLLDGKADPAKVLAGLLRAPLAKPGRLADLSYRAIKASHLKLSSLLSKLIEAQPRIRRLSQEFFTLPMSLFVSGGSTPGEVWQELVHSEEFPDLLLTSELESFMTLWPLRRESELGRTLAGRFFAAPFPTKERWEALIKETLAFERQREELAKKHAGDFVIMSGGALRGFFSSCAEAHEVATNTLGIDQSFLVARIEKRQLAVERRIIGSRRPIAA